MLSMTRTVWVIAPIVILLAAAVTLKLRLAPLRNVALLMLLPATLGGIIGLTVGLSMPSHQWQMGDPWELTPQQIDEMVRQRMFAPATPEESVSNPQSAISNPQSAITPVPAGQGTAVGDRVGEMLDGQTGSLDTRLRIYRDAFEGWLQRPILGWGAGAFPLVYPPPITGGYWIANLELHVLFDTGIVGLLLLAIGVGSVAWRCVTALRPSPATWSAAQYATFGLLWAGLSLFAAFLLTYGLGLVFAWFYVAFLGAASNLAWEG
jgi:hypothetical protein